MTIPELDGFKKDIVGTLRWYLGTVLFIFVAFFGWLALSHMSLKSDVRENKQEVRDFKRDMGHTLIEMTTREPASGVYDKMAEKYNPYRATLNKNGDE